MPPVAVGESLAVAFRTDLGVDAPPVAAGAQLISVRNPSTPGHAGRWARRGTRRYDCWLAEADCELADVDDSPITKRIRVRYENDVAHVVSMHRKGLLDKDELKTKKVRLAPMIVTDRLLFQEEHGDRFLKLLEARGLELVKTTPVEDFPPSAKCAESSHSDVEVFIHHRINYLSESHSRISLLFILTSIAGSRGRSPQEEDESEGEALGCRSIYSSSY